MTRPRTRRRIEIGWFEAIVLVFGYVLSLGVVGLGGIYVGQRAVQQRLGAKERVFRLPIDGGPGSPNPGVAAEEPDITFYETLGKGEARPEGRIIMPGEKEKSGREAAAAKPAAGDPAGAKATAPAVAATKSPDRPSPRQGAASAPEPQQAVAARPPLPAFGSAPGSVTSPGSVPRPAAERLPTEEQPRAVAPSAPGLRTLPASPAESRPAGRQPALPSDPATGSRSRESATATDDDLDREPAPPQTGSRVTPEAAATARALLNSSPAEVDQQTGAGSWSVQVNATQERGVADRLVSDLRARGYDAFIVTQTREGAVWYRVRVGRLASLEKANALVGELKERAGLSHAFVASD
jgi:cell division septation protein DedD